jgi:hypothetical protein
MEDLKQIPSLNEGISKLEAWNGLVDLLERVEYEPSDYPNDSPEFDLDLSSKARTYIKDSIREVLEHMKGPKYLLKDDRE